MTETNAQDYEGSIRSAHCAGRWYPGDKATLANEVDKLLDQAAPTSIPSKPVAVIAPHAGYRYSAPTAAGAYRCLHGHAYHRVIAFAFSHRNAGSYQGVDVSHGLSAYETPLGQVPIDRAACEALSKKSGFVSQPGIDRDEHSLELQLPFLQRTLKDWRLAPLLVGRMTDVEYSEAAKAISPYVDSDTLIVVSSDFTHFGDDFGYHPFRDNVPERLRQLGDQAASPILACDYDGFAAHLAKTNDTICGRGPILLLLRILSMQGGASGVRSAFTTSGDLTQDWNSSVTYQSFVFSRRPGNLAEDDRSELLKLARRTVGATLAGEDPPKVDTAKLPNALRQNGACFVTLQNHGRLRGCIGNMEADGPLYEAVMRNAVLACQDSRFVSDPLKIKELPELHIEISYLTPMKRVKKTEEIIIGRHGLFISAGMWRGVLLPQVAYERGWTRSEFLNQTCHKASLPQDAWKDPDTTIHSFEAEVFGEDE